MRKLDEAKQLYHSKRRGTGRDFKNNVLSFLEGRPFYRFGDSWYRRSSGHCIKAIISDDSDVIVIDTPLGKFEM